MRFHGRSASNCVCAANAFRECIVNHDESDASESSMSNSIFGYIWSSEKVDYRLYCVHIIYLILSPVMLFVGQKLIQFDADFLVHIFAGGRIIYIHSVYI